MTARGRPTPLLRMVLRGADTEACHRIVLIEGDRWAWVADMAEQAWPSPRALDQLADEIGTGAMQVVPDPFARAALEAGADLDRHAERSEARWALIEPLVASDVVAALMRETHRARLLNARAAEAGTTYQNLVKLLRQYWARGMTPAAVAVAYGRCGAPGRRRSLGDAKPGRRRTVATGAGIPVTLAERRLLEVAATYHLDGDMTQRDAFQRMIEQFYASVVTDASGRTKVTVPQSIPSIGQFRYYLRTHHSTVEQRRRRKGQHAFDLEDRALLGRADDGVQGPGSCYQLDATIADTYLVSSFDRTRIVGRPVIYFVVDVWSRLIVGLYVGFEGPSWLGAVAAMVNAVTPKVEFCRSLGIEIEEAEWPSHHLPAAVFGDRGEMISVRNGRNLESRHQVSILNAAAGRGDMKAIVERLFGTVQAKYKSFIPGYVKPDFGKRGAEDYRKGAVLTLEEFTKVIALAVLQHNRTPPRKKTKPAGMVAEGLSAAPTAMWAWGIRHRSGALSVADVDAVALSLLPTADARVTARGVRLFGAYYLSDEVAELGWFAHARHEESTREVSFDPRCMDAIYVQDERLERRYSRLELRRDDPWRGRSLAEVEQNEELSAAADAGAAHALLESDIAARLTVDAVIAEAKAATAAARGGRRPTAGDLRGIRDNHLEEKERRRPREALRPGLVVPPPAAAPEADEADVEPAKPVDRLERLRLQRERRETDG